MPIQLPGGPDSSTYSGGQEVTTMLVVGGAGDEGILHGTLLIGGNQPLYHAVQHGLERHFTFARRLCTVLEFDPSLVESI